MSGSKMSKVYVNGRWVEPTPKLKLYKEVNQKEIDKKIIEKQKEIKELRKRAKD